MTSLSVQNTILYKSRRIESRFSVQQLAVTIETINHSKQFRTIQRAAASACIRPLVFGYTFGNFETDLIDVDCSLRTDQ